MTFSRGPNDGGNKLGESKAGGINYPQMDSQEIEQFMIQFATKIRYWKSVQCPCTNSSTGQPNMACNQCRGLGYFHLDVECDPKFQRAQVQSRSSTENREAPGTFVTGTASITFMPGVFPGDGDLVQVCADRDVINDEYHVRGSKLLDLTTAETLRFRDVIKVDTVVVRESNNSSVLRSELWSYNKLSRTIIFNPDLTVGTRYAVRYIAIPEYVVLGDTSRPFVRVAHDESSSDPEKDHLYPYNVQATRLDRAILSREKAVTDTSAPTASTTPRGPFR